jgi:hypothetical protein
MTSAEMPSAARISAALRDMGTVAASATTVTSVPARLMAALPIGMAWSGGGAGPLLAKSPLCSKNTTGSSLRIAEAMRPTTSEGVDGATIFSPGTVRAQFSTDCECWAPNPRPPPFAVRITSGTVTWPPVM